MARTRRARTPPATARPRNPCPVSAGPFPGEYDNRRTMPCAPGKHPAPPASTITPLTEGATRADLPAAAVPLSERASAAPRDAPPPHRESVAPVPVAPPPLPRAALQPIPQPPQPVPAQALQPAASQVMTQSPQADRPGAQLAPRPARPAASTGDAVVRLLASRPRMMSSVKVSIPQSV